MRHLIIIIANIKKAMPIGLFILVPSVLTDIMVLRYMPTSWVMAARTKDGIKIDLSFILNKSLALDITGANDGLWLLGFFFIVL